MFMSETSTFKWYTEQLALIDFSQRKLAHKSICNPTVAVEDDELFKQMNEILKNSADKDYEIVRKRPTADTVLNGAPAYDIINLTDISYADKFSYLTSYHFDILSRFYFLYGFSWQAPMKTQYESKDQLNYRDQCCDIYISNMYETRYNDYKKACDGLGIEFNFDFSEQWKRDKVTENDEKGVNDNEHKDISKNE